MKRKNITTQMMKEYIAEALLRLMSNKPYAEISISEIAERAGVNRSTYYRNFDSKESIIEFCFSNMMSEYLGDYRKMSDTSAGNYLLTMFTCFFRNKKTLLLIHENGLSYLILGVLNRAFDEGDKGKDLSQAERYKRYFHIGGIYNTFVLWFLNGMEETPEEMTEITLSLFPQNAVPMFLA